MQGAYAIQRAFVCVLGTVVLLAAPTSGYAQSPNAEASGSNAVAVGLANLPKVAASLGAIMNLIEKSDPSLQGVDGFFGFGGKLTIVVDQSTGQTVIESTAPTGGTRYEFNAANLQKIEVSTSAAQETTFQQDATGKSHVLTTKTGASAFASIAFETKGPSDVQVTVHSMPVYPGGSDTQHGTGDHVSMLLHCSKERMSELQTKIDAINRLVGAAEAEGH